MLDARTPGAPVRTIDAARVRERDLLRRSTHRAEQQLSAWYRGVSNFASALAFSGASHADVIEVLLHHASEARRRADSQCLAQMLLGFPASSGDPRQLGQAISCEEPELAVRLCMGDVEE